MTSFPQKCLLALLLFAGGASAATTFSPYVDISINTHWSSETQSLEPVDLNAIAAQTNLNAFHLAFVTDSGNCQPAWASQPDYSLANKWGQHLTDTLAKQGIETTVSFGGLAGNDISMNCNTSQLVTIFNQTVSTYQAKKLDFDIENGTANVPNLMMALSTFQQKNPTIKISITLPVLPDGLTPAGKDVVSQAVQAKLNFTVNIMTMDYGPAYNADMGDYTKQAATALQVYLKTLYPNKSDDELWQKVEVTPMIGVNDVPTEQFTLQNASAVRTFAIDHHLGGYSMWSLTRDKPCADKWASTSCSGNNLQKNDYDFSRAFLGSK